MGLTIGVDIGGTKIAAGVVDEDGTIIRSVRRSTPSHDAEAVITIIVSLVRELSAKAEAEGIGIGVAGLVNSGRSTVMVAPNLGWVDTDLKAAVEDELDIGTVVENDANAAAWGEYRFGAGQGRTDMVMVTIGTGIGGGMVLGGRLQRGANGMAAEFGHLEMVPGGRACGCGKEGCWEQYGSGNALVRTARDLASEDRKGAAKMLALGDGTPEGVQGLHITEAALDGDPVAKEAFDTVGHWIGVGLSDVAALMDPGIFVIGGGVVESGDLLMSPTRAAFEVNLVARDNRPLTPVVAATLGNKAGIAGAADLARLHD